MKIFNCFGNSVSETGGAIYCRKGQVTLLKGNILHNSAKEEGGCIFGENCRVVFDYAQIVNNTVVHPDLYYYNGAEMYFKASEVEIHNSEGVKNNARNFAVVKMNSKFKSNYLHLPDAEWNCINILSSSKAEMKHTSLGSINWVSSSKAEMKHTSLGSINWEIYCTFHARFDSNINLVSVYYTDLNYTRKTQGLFKNYENIVCTDDTSNASIIEG